MLFWWQHTRVALNPQDWGQGKSCVVGVSHLVSLSPSLISFSLPLHYPNREGQESFPAKLDESFRAVMEPSWSGSFKCTAHTFPLIHKMLSMREPDKQHYYYHQSPCAKETEEAKGVEGCPSWLIQWKEEAGLPLPGAQR